MLFSATARVDSPLRACRPEEDHNQVPSTSTALMGIRSVNVLSVPKRKEAEGFELEPWPQVSTFGSWNCPPGLRCQHLVLGTVLSRAETFQDHLTSGWSATGYGQQGSFFDDMHLRGLTQILPGICISSHLIWPIT